MELWKCETISYVSCRFVTYCFGQTKNNFGRDAAWFNIIYIYTHTHTHTHTREGESNENLKSIYLTLTLLTWRMWWANNAVVRQNAKYSVAGWSTHSCGPGSVVSIATGYGLDGRGIESRWGRDFPYLYRPALGPTQPPVQWLPGFSRG